jgi:hypothetical protein
MANDAFGTLRLAHDFHPVPIGPVTPSAMSEVFRGLETEAGLIIALAAMASTDAYWQGWADGMETAERLARVSPLMVHCVATITSAG